MEINEYQKLAMRTASEESKKNMLLNGVLGLCGESGEVADIIKKHMFQGHVLNNEFVAEELGDVCWYLAMMATGLGISLEEIMQKNIDKLKKRYPKGFEVEKSVKRESAELNVYDFYNEDTDTYDLDGILEYFGFKVGDIVSWEDDRISGEVTETRFKIVEKKYDNKEIIIGRIGAHDTGVRAVSSVDPNWFFQRKFVKI